MARKKTAPKNSNSYWMKFGGAPRRMDKGGFTHPHPHPKNATDAQKRGAQIWSTTTQGDNKPLQKRTTYDWSSFDSETAGADVAAFKQTRWFDFFPDTSKNIPRTQKELAKYEKAIDAHQSRTIELYDTKFDDVTPVGQDGTKEEFLTECGLELHHPEAFGILKGIGLDNAS